MSAERNTLRILIEAVDDGLEIEVDRGSGWEPWQATSNGIFTTADVMLATAEYLGHIIVEMSDTPVAGMQAAQVASDHLVSTVKAGMTAKGFNMGGH